MGISYIYNLYVCSGKEGLSYVRLHSKEETTRVFGSRIKYLYVTQVELPAVASVSKSQAHQAVSLRRQVPPAQSINTCLETRQKLSLLKTRIPAYLVEFLEFYLHLLYWTKCLYNMWKKKKEKDFREIVFPLYRTKTENTLQICRFFIFKLFPSRNEKHSSNLSLFHC